LHVARQCTFCPNQAKSREDIYPVWLQQKIGNVGPILHRIIRVPSAELHSPVVKAKTVCPDCNQGWMSTLEGETKPIISPVISDLSIALTSRDQNVLARWIVKTSMMLDSASRRGRESCYSRASRERLRTHNEVPRLTAIWLGRFFRHELFSRAAHVWFTINEIPKAAHGCVTTFILGYLVIQSVTIYAGPEYTEENFPRVKCAPGPWNETLVQIWPNSGVVNWPPPHFFVGAGSHAIGLFVNRWFQGAKPV
jgi:hypothetical protein